MSWDKNIVSSISSWYTNPPHSPILSLIAAFCESLNITSTHLIYFVNAIIISSSIYFTLKLVTTKNQLAICLTAVVIATPLGSLLMFNFRPDCLYAITICYLVCAAGFLPSKNLSVQFPAIICFALVVKPSFIAYTFVYACFVFMWILFLRNKNIFFNKFFVMSLFMSLLVISWYLPIGAVENLKYAIKNSTSSQSVLWTSPNFLKAIIVNLRGLVSQLDVGFSLVAILAICLLIASLLSNKQNLKTLSLFCGISFIDFVISSASKFNNPFFYLDTILPFIFLSMTILKDGKNPILVNDIEIVARKKYTFQFLEKKRGYAGLIFLVIFCLLLPTNEWSSSSIRTSGSVNRSFANYLSKSPSASVAFFITGPLNCDTTNWYLGKKAEKYTLTSVALNFQNTTEAARVFDSVKNYSYLVTRKNNQPGYPSDEMQNFINNLASSNGWKPNAFQNYIIWSRKRNI